MSEQKKSFMDEQDFDALLSRSLPELPPEDIVARTVPGKEVLSRILVGYLLYTFVIHFIGLDLILPVIGQILVLLGFRALQHENHWFSACYLLEVVHAVFLFGKVILGTTIIELPDTTTTATLAVYYLQTGLTILSLFCFWRGLRTVQKQLAIRSKAVGVLALIALNVLVAVIGTLQLLGDANFGSLHVFAFLLICYLVVLWTIARLARSLDETGYVLQPAPVQISDRAYTLILVGLLAIGCAAGYLFFGSYAMDWRPVSATEQAATQATKDHLRTLGLPEEVLADLAPEDLATLGDAEQVILPLEDKAIFQNDSGYDEDDIRLTNVAVLLPDDRVVFFHHFRWLKDPGFSGTEALCLNPAYEDSPWTQVQGSEVTGRLLYDDEEGTLTASYHSITAQTVADPIFTVVPAKDLVYASFSFPDEGEVQRGYLTYTATPSEGDQILIIQMTYIHQQHRFQYPVETAEEYDATHFSYGEGTPFTDICWNRLFLEWRDGTITAVE